MAFIHTLAGIFTPKTYTGFTCNLSTINGTAFITNPSINLSGFAGRKATITAGGKTLVGWIKAAGTGEAYDSEIITGWTNRASFGYETLTTSGSTITSAINSSGYGIAYSDTNAVTTGELYKVTAALTLNSGAYPIMKIIKTPPTFSGPISGTVTLSVGANVIYFTATGTDAGGNLQCNAGSDEQQATNFSLSDVSRKKVLTPSATGVTIVSVKSGTTYNWTSNDGIDPTAASFTLTVTRD